MWDSLHTLEVDKSMSTGVFSGEGKQVVGVWVNRNGLEKPEQRSITVKQVALQGIEEMVVAGLGTINCLGIT